MGLVGRNLEQSFPFEADEVSSILEELSLIMKGKGPSRAGALLFSGDRPQAESHRQTSTSNIREIYG
jgi:hypothetical protein